MLGDTVLKRNASGRWRVSTVNQRELLREIRDSAAAARRWTPSDETTLMSDRDRIATMMRDLVDVPPCLCDSRGARLAPPQDGAGYQLKQKRSILFPPSSFVTSARCFRDTPIVDVRGPIFV
jgi:hypothetical protein